MMYVYRHMRKEKESFAVLELPATEKEIFKTATYEHNLPVLQLQDEDKRMGT